MTNILITMAGRGSRFYKAGYQVPKYAIEVHGRTLFEWSMKSLEGIIRSDDRLIFVCLAENNSGDFVRSMCAAMGFSNVVIQELDGVTDGQATSAYLTRSHWRYLCGAFRYQCRLYPPRIERLDSLLSSAGQPLEFRAPGQ
jgi:choline kinase